MYCHQVDICESTTRSGALASTSVLAWSSAAAADGIADLSKATADAAVIVIEDGRVTVLLQPGQLCNAVCMYSSQSTQKICLHLGH